MFVFFLNMQNTQCGYHGSLSSLMDPLVPKMRRLRLEDAPGQGMVEADSSTDQKAAKKTAAGETDTGQ
jgi:hypothetical protein